MYLSLPVYLSLFLCFRTHPLASLTNWIFSWTPPSDDHHRVSTEVVQLKPFTQCDSSELVLIVNQKQKLIHKWDQKESHIHTDRVGDFGKSGGHCRSHQQSWAQTYESHFKQAVTKSVQVVKHCQPTHIMNGRWWTYTCERAMFLLNHTDHWLEVSQKDLSFDLITPLILRQLMSHWMTNYNTLPNSLGNYITRNTEIKNLC